MGLPTGNTTIWDYNPDSLRAVTIMNCNSTRSFQDSRSVGVHASSGFYSPIVGIDIPEVTGVDEFPEAMTSGTDICYPSKKNYDEAGNFISNA